MRCKRIALMVLVGVVVATVLRVAGAQELTTPAAGFRVPGVGLVSMEQGAIEGWVRLAVDAPPTASEGHVGVLWTLTATDPAQPSGIALSFGKLDNQMRMRLGAIRDGAEVDPPAWVTLSGYKSGEWHHVAMVWTGGRTVSVYWDGQPVIRDHSFNDWNFSMAVGPAGGLMIGHPPRSIIAVDELRVSSMARQPEDLGHAASQPLAPDPATVLLLAFENVDESARPRTIAAEHAATAAARSLVVADNCSVVPGRFGNAMALCQGAAFATRSE